MKSRKHRHKESFSILLVSNTGQNTRHFHVTGLFFRLSMVFVVCICAAFGWLTYQYLSASDITSSYVDAREGTRETELMGQIAEQSKLMQQLEDENNALTRRNDELVSENKALLAAAKANKGTEETGVTNSDDNPENDPAYPSLYPYSETGEVSVKYSESHPYVTIDTQAQGDVVAAGTGIIAAVDSDDTYPLIIEIEHGNGYRTRYMFLQDAQALRQAGTRVQAGTALVSIDVQNVQLDYQVIFDEEPIDPLIVFEAKG